jgi:GNAT superfamily N-acetyltransferase/8-oxo-dGTP pyrophosphatase MutT (NUDIX family)
MNKSSPFHFRPLDSGDQDFLWEMLYQAVYVPPGTLPPPREIIHDPALARYVQEWPQHGDLGFAALKPGSAQPVGAAWLRPFSSENPGYGFIDSATPELSVALLPQVRGQGLGTHLLSRLLEAAREQYPAVSLSVSIGNPAEALYRRLGFEVHTHDEHSLIMKKDWIPVWTEIHHQPGLDSQGSAIRREAVRGIIQDGTRLLMIFSAQNGDFKFPGGGIQKGETHFDALRREIMEECGATISQVAACAGKVIEYDVPIEAQLDVFKMTSYYYPCQIEGELGELKLDEYERDLGFSPVWVEIQTAIQTNAALIDQLKLPAQRWTRRELLVLEKLWRENPFS